MSSGAGGGFDMERTLVRPARSEWKGTGAGGGWLLAVGGSKVGEEFGEFVRVGMGKLDDGRAQRGLERHRKIAGVTKSSISKLVEQVT